MRVMLAVVAATTLFALASHAKGTLSPIVGVSSVVDGDGVSVGGYSDVRLQGIAAPEDGSYRREPGGPESTANLRAFTEGKSIVCIPDGTEARGRPVAVCSLNGKDIGLYQVETGHARDCPRFSKGRYAAAEARAKAAGHDLSAVYPLPSYCTRR